MSKKYRHKLSKSHRISKIYFPLDKLLERLNEEYEQGFYTDDEYEEIKDRLIGEFYELLNAGYFDDLSDDE